MKKYLPLILAASLLATPAVSAQQAGAVDPAERAKIEAVIQDYLMENPEIIMLAVRELQRRQTVAQMKPTIDLYRDYLENEKDAPVLGNPNGDVTIVEFFDYRCGFCRRHYPAVMKLVQEDGNIRLVPRQFPILDQPGATPLSMMAARAALAAQRQGKFAQFHKAVMTSSGQITEDGLYTIAASVGLDVARLKTDMNDKLIDKKIQNELAIGKDIGFEGTPGYIIGDDVVLGAEGYERLKDAVVRARKQVAENTAPKAD
ncbi:MAG: DsbA family protein [Alphaproteobacteria bacterium]|nr:MAG: DsbA family protein [Alphaproteobacteria bacterium]